MVGVATADGVDTVAAGVDPPHDEESEANAMPSRAAISGEPNQSLVVTVRTGSFTAFRSNRPAGCEAVAAILGIARLASKRKNT